jgi:hypothetical protein
MVKAFEQKIFFVSVQEHENDTRLRQVKWFPAGNIFNDIKIFHLTIFNIVWGKNK